MRPTFAGIRWLERMPSSAMRQPSRATSEAAAGLTKPLRIMHAPTRTRSRRTTRTFGKPLTRVASPSNRLSRRLSKPPAERPPQGCRVARALRGVGRSSQLRAGVPASAGPSPDSSRGASSATEPLGDTAFVRPRRLIRLPIVAIGVVQFLVALPREGISAFVPL
jgi:hypothetical protein